jgi:hypothetical protein
MSLPESSQANGQVGPLRQYSISKAGPYGAVGTVLWLCDQHGQEVTKWHEIAEPKPKEVKDAISRALASSKDLMHWPNA